jgi:phage baseplate assembly protein V
MYRVGIVKAQDVYNARVRVSFPDRDQLQSWWLPVVFPKTQNDKGYWIPDVGEQVVCTMDEHDEDGAVLGAIYSSADAVPVANADKLHWTSKDGAFFEYDRSTHGLQMNIGNGGSVTIAASGASIAIDGSGNIAINGAGNVAIDGAGNVTIMASALIQLAGGGPAIARVGDATSCPAGPGVIVSGSSKVNAG